MATVMQENSADLITGLLERARGMVPALKARAEAATAARALPEQTIREMHEAGFWRVLQPRRYGGYELHPSVFFDIQMLSLIHI